MQVNKQPVEIVPEEAQILCLVDYFNLDIMNTFV